MKKAWIFLQWLLVLGVGLLTGYALLKPLPKPDYAPEIWHSWQGFVALSYAGITEQGESGYVSPKRLEEQLWSLRQAGYRSITPEDAAAFLAGRSPLPEKALLLIFEGGRKDSYLYATPLLRKYRMMAVVCVPTRRTRDWGSFYLNEKELKELSGQPHWRLGSMGDEAIDTIALDGLGTRGHFLTHPRWLGDRRENAAVFRDRVRSDYAKAAQLLERAAGRPVAAYLYPFADAGSTVTADPLATPINREALIAHHRLAFVHAHHPFNGPGSDAYALGRLRVSGDWDGIRLLREIARFLPRRDPVGGLGDSDRWLIQGPAQLRRHQLRVGAGAVAWVGGSDRWTDVDLRATLRLTPGAVASLYARYAGPRAYLRLSLNSQGVRLQECLGSTLQTLAWLPLSGGVGRSHGLRLRVKANRAWAWYDGLPIASPIPLAASTTRGRIGLGSQDGRAEVLDFQARPLPSLWLLADHYSALPPALQEEIGVILPSHLFPDGAPQLDGQRRKELLAAASVGVKTIPLIQTPSPLTPSSVEALAARVEAALDHPAVKLLVTHLAVVGDDPLVPRALRRRGYHVVRVVTPQQAIRWVERRQPVGELLLEGPPGEARAALPRLLHVIPADRLILRMDSAAPVAYGVRTALRWESAP